MQQRSFFHHAAAAAIAVGFLASFPAAAGPFGSLVVFGDSLSDSGNNAAVGLYDPAQIITGNDYVPSSTYAPGTYSNGPVWASDFASMLGLPLGPSLLGGTDYAYGGATTGTPGANVGPLGPGFPYSLAAQTGQYLMATGGLAFSDALYVVAGGGNDARAALTAAAVPGADVPSIFAATAMSFASTVGDIVDELQLAGAEHILVWNTPNLGTTPAVASAGFGAFGSFLASAMNDALGARLAGESGVSVFDIFGFGTAVAADPAAFGFTNATDACGAVAGADCSGYLYWDGIHPTAAAHLAIADAVYSVAVPVPEPETWALMAGGLALLGAGARRRRGRYQPAGALPPPSRS